MGQLLSSLEIEYTASLNTFLKIGIQCLFPSLWGAESNSSTIYGSINIFFSGFSWSKTHIKNWIFSLVYWFIHTLVTYFLMIRPTLSILQLSDINPFLVALFLLIPSSVSVAICTAFYVYDCCCLYWKYKLGKISHAV